MTNMKEYEVKRWNSGNAWSRASIALNHDLMHELTREELNDCISQLKRRNFIAEMSDSYSVTCAEREHNRKIVTACREELERRNNCKRYYCAVYNFVSEEGMDFYIEAANVYDARVKAIETAQGCGDYPEYISCFDLELVS